MMWVSHETIYRSPCVHGRGELRRELSRCLRSGKAVRRSRSRSDRKSRIREMVMISERSPRSLTERCRGTGMAFTG